MGLLHSSAMNTVLAIRLRNGLLRWLTAKGRLLRCCLQNRQQKIVGSSKQQLWDNSSSGLVRGVAAAAAWTAGMRLQYFCNNIISKINPDLIFLYFKPMLLWHMDCYANAMKGESWGSIIGSNFLSLAHADGRRWRTQPRRGLYCLAWPHRTRTGGHARLRPHASGRNSPGRNILNWFADVDAGCCFTS